MSEPTKVVLVVDHKETNLVLLAGMLEAEGYQVITATDDRQAWDILKTDRHHFHTVLWDWEMPNMNGLEVLRWIKGHPRYQSIPVIVQTAVHTQKEILEGMEAGAFYYLTKPYQKKILVSIVQSAIRHYTRRLQWQQELPRTGRPWSFLQSGIFHVRTLQEARELGSFLAKGCPDPNRAILGLVEVLVNAVEHGHLGISYEEKSRLGEQDQVDAEIERRLNLPENANKYVEVAFVRRVGAIVMTVTDQGPGFDWEPYLTFDETRAFNSHGRGIAMARMLSFDKLEYRGGGNQVVCTIRTSSQPVLQAPEPVSRVTP